MWDNNYHELNNIFWNSLNYEKNKMLADYLDKNEELLYSSKHRKLIQKILENRSCHNILAPAFGVGMTISWMEGKKIVAFEQNVSTYDLAKLIWEGKEINLYNCDFLNEDIKDKFDTIIFTSPYGWVRTVSGKSIRLEREYINKALSCLDENGLLVMTVPSNVLTAHLWQDTRERIIEDFSLEMIIYDGRIFPGVSIDWYTVIISRSNPQEAVYYAKLNNNIDDIMANFNSVKGEFWVATKELHNRLDIDYMNPKYASFRKEIYSKDTTRLDDLAEIIRGVGFSAGERLESGDYMILTPGLIDENMIIENDNRFFFCNEDSINNQRARDAVLQQNDIVISLMGNLNWCRYEGNSKKIIANHNVAIIRTKPEYSRYLEMFFGSTTGQEYLKNQTNIFAIGGVLRNLSISDLKQFIIPDIKVLEKATRYQEIRNPIIKIKNAFTEAGWEVKEDYSNGAFILDLALFYNGDLRGAIEVKNYKSKDLRKKNQLNDQLRKYKKALQAKYLFVFLNEELYLYANKQLIRMPEIPSPNFNIKKELELVYLEEEELDSVVIRQLPNEAVSLSDSYLTEALWRTQIMNRLERIEGKLDHIKEAIKEIARQITNYQSLVERQIDRAIGADEIERIIQSFSDECSERIIDEVNRNYSEHEFLIEENKLKASIGSMAWDKLDESSQTFLVSSKLMYNNLISIGNVVDYSGVCLLVTKALEVEMSKRFCRNYTAFLTERYPGKENLKIWPTSLLSRYGKKIKTKDFTLGSVAYILGYSFADGISEEEKHNNQVKLLEYAKNELFIEGYDNEEILACLLQYAEWIEEVRKNYRNPSAHTNELKKVDAENCFDLVTDVEKILKIMMDTFRS